MSNDESQILAGKRSTTPVSIRANSGPIKTVAHSIDSEKKVCQRTSVPENVVRGSSGYEKVEDLLGGKDEPSE